MEAPRRKRFGGVKFEYRHEDSNAVLAPNWRRILLVDGLVGVLAIVSGVASLLAWNRFVGVVLVLLGILYSFAVVGRYRAWSERRREAGLDGP